MGSTNKTSGELKLSQFIDTDKPTWLGDYNADMLAISEAHTAQAAAIGQANSAATAAGTAASSAHTAATEADTKADAASGKADAAEASANAATAGLTDRYTKTESDARYAPKTPAKSLAVFIGNSQSLTGSFAEQLPQIMNWDSYNYAQGGTGFGYGNASTPDYNGQVNAAAADSRFVNADVDYVFIVDAGNDVRGGSASIPALASACFANARTKFPNARIVVVPLLWGHAVQNEGVGPLAGAAKAVVDVTDAAVTNGCEVVPFSHLWHWGFPALMLPGEVHYTIEGQNVITQYLKGYLRGGQTDRGMAWTNVTPEAGYSTGSSLMADMRPLQASRQGDTVFLNGGLYGPANAGNTAVCTLPLGLRPSRETFIVIQHSEALTGATPVSIPARIMPSGAVLVFGARSAAGTHIFNASFAAF